MNEFEQERIYKAQKEIESIIASGAPIVKLDIFDILDNYVPSEDIRNQVEYTMELYLDLVNKLKEYSDEEQQNFLQTLKESDIIDNQSIEKEDSFLIALHKKFEHSFSIDLLIEKICTNTPISKEEFISIHDTLLLGTSSEDKLGLRDNDLKFVGSFDINPNTKYHFENRAISYFPLKHTEIDIAINKFLNFINSNIKPNDQYDAMLLPIICHGLIATLQLFKDGNTRYGRLFQNVLIYKLANEELNLNLNLPLVYATRQYASFRGAYRQKLENIVLNNNNEAWEEWINFNLKRIQDGIFYNFHCLDTLDVYKGKTR
ncbi:MAG: Fic family protein [Bacilli bacterium]|nr:Fic family protein [Bacilli bacterium]